MVAEKMKIKLIKPNDDMVINDKLDYPYSLLCLATILERHGHTVEILELHQNDIELIGEADIYGLTCVTATFNQARILGERLSRQYPKARIWFGGKHFIDAPAKLNLPGEVFVGEADETVVNAVGSKRKKAWIGNEDIDINTVHPLNFNLIDLFHPQRGTICGFTRAILQLSRGCYFNCAFCYNCKRQVKYIKSEVFSREISRLESLKVKAINITDDNFLALPLVADYLQICRESDMIFRCLGRANLLSKWAKEAYDAGIKIVHVGVESGSAKMLKLMNKRLTSEQISIGLSTARDAGLHIEISIIVGFPGETWETIQETIKFLKEIPYHTVSVFPFVPFPGSDVWNNPAKYKITWISDNTDEFRPLDRHGKPKFCFETANLNLDTLYAMWQHMSNAVFENRKYKEAFIVA